jgi:hypothetical protein
MESAHSRRSVLSVTALVAVGVAGCLGSEPVPGLVVRNEMDESVSFAIEIFRQSDESSVFSENGSLASGESVSYADPVPEAGEYTIEAEAGDRTESYEWSFSDDDSVGVRLVFEPDSWELSEFRG